MRILLTYRDHFSELPGGIERHVHELAHGLADRAEVDILFPSRKKGIEDDGGVTLIRNRELIRIHGVPVSPRFGAVMRRGRYDIVHVHSPDPTAECSFLASRAEAVGIVTHHADVDRGASFAPLYRRFLRLVHRRAAAVIATSSVMVDRSPGLEW
ncbi:MAG TPA: glycosyltransferase, partial [Actinomycetota bacterium]|nr:glycosyltransferase [Actinomycetota bacterium]